VRYFLAKEQEMRDNEDEYAYGKYMGSAYFYERV
jgi:hypothetical protein